MLGQCWCQSISGTMISSTLETTMILIFKTLNLEKCQSGSARTKKAEKVEQLVKCLLYFFFKISEEAFGLTRLKNIVDKIMWSMKAQPHNPMGKLIWESCKKEEEHICNYLMNQHHNKAEIMEKNNCLYEFQFWKWLFFQAQHPLESVYGQLWHHSNIEN